MICGQDHPRDDWALGNARNSRQGLHTKSGAQGLKEVRAHGAWGLVSWHLLYKLGQDFPKLSGKVAAMRYPQGLNLVLSTKSSVPSVLIGQTV